jgi:hypothetical protein
VPTSNLKQLLEGSDPAWQRDEAVGQLGHERLALVHRADHAEVGEPAMCDLLLDERTRQTPVTSLPATSAASASTPMRPTEAPP